MVSRTGGGPPFVTDAYTVTEPGGRITLEPVQYWGIAEREAAIEIETSAVSICATDLKAAAGKFLMGPPMLLGHECAGTITRVSYNIFSGTIPLKEGDKVVLSYASCRECPACELGDNAYCRELAKLNFTGVRDNGSTMMAVVTRDDRLVHLKGLFFGQSSMGRRILARPACAVKLPDDTTEEEMRMFASLGCGIQTGAGAIFNVAKPPPNSRILIFGAGTVGLSACLAAKLTSPEKLVVVDHSMLKLAMLPTCIKEAATDLVDSSDAKEDELVNRLKALTRDGQGYDYALDCVGRGDLVKIGHLALRPRGTVVTVGGSTDTALQVTLSQHLTRGITYKGTHQGDSVPSVVSSYATWGGV